MDWRSCTQNRLVRQVPKDVRHAKALIESSDKRRTTAEMLPLNKTTASTIVTLWYDLLRELLSALSSLHGYSISNHECYRSFLGEHLGRERLAGSFDTLRKVRNSINYYGKDLPVGRAEEMVDRARANAAETKRLLNELI